MSERNVDFTVKETSVNIDKDDRSVDFDKPGQTSMDITTGVIPEIEFVTDPTEADFIMVNRNSTVTAPQVFTASFEVDAIPYHGGFIEEADDYDYNANYIYYGWEELDGSVVIRRRDRDTDQLFQAVNLDQALSYDDLFLQRASHSYDEVVN